jgi:hypothetical protein
VAIIAEPFNIDKCDIFPFYIDIFCSKTQPNLGGFPLAVVDVHTRVVPNSLAGLPPRHRPWPTLQMREAGQAALMIDGKPFREIDARSCDVERRMHDMAADGIDVQVLWPMPELLSHWLPMDLADHLARIVNDHIIEMIGRAPDKFQSIGMVPMQNVELATKRLDGVQKQRLRGVEIGTHIDGVPLGDPRLSLGVLLDRIFAPRLTAIVFLAPALAFSMLLLSNTAGANAKIAAAFLGFGLGAEVEALAYIASRAFGLRYFGPILGFLMVGFALGLGFGPTLFDKIYDQFQTYQLALWIAAGISAASSGLIVTLRRTDLPFTSERTGTHI